MLVLSLKTKVSCKFLTFSNMAQIDIVTYGLTVVQIYVAFWVYFCCCVVATTGVFQSAYFNNFLGYSVLFSSYSKFVSLFR